MCNCKHLLSPIAMTRNSAVLGTVNVVAMRPVTQNTQVSSDMLVLLWFSHSVYNILWQQAAPCDVLYVSYVCNSTIPP
jgi:hypothetical protein